MALGIRPQDQLPETLPWELEPEAASETSVMEAHSGLPHWCLQPGISISEGALSTSSPFQGHVALTEYFF